MSFLNVVGKIYRCSECQKSIRIEYQDGARLTQIGDWNVTSQLELSKKLGQPNDNPDENGYYLYDIRICIDCFNKQNGVLDNDKLETIGQINNDLLERREKTVADIEELTPGILDDIISPLTLTDVENIIGGSVDPSFGDKHATPKKRKRLINEFLDQHRDKFAEFFRRKAWQESDIQQIVKGYNALAEPAMKKLKKLIPTDTPFYIAKHTNAAENLNDLICYEHTIRKPVDESPDHVFVFEQEIDEEMLFDDFKLTSSALPMAIYKKLMANMLSF